jgi:hypothetical protein
MGKSFAENTQLSFDYENSSEFAQYEIKSKNTFESKIHRLEEEYYEKKTDLSYDKENIGLSISEIVNLNRQLTIKISTEEVDKLFREHDLLINKKFKGGFSKHDEIRLRMVRWELDRIEDAFIGEKIDHLESFVDGYEKLADDINNFVDSIIASRKKKGFKK